MFNVRDQSDGSHPRRLAATVLAYASNIDRLHMLESAITSIGRKHISLNVRPEQYPIVGKHLLEAVKTVLGDAATPELLDAWAAARRTHRGEILHAFLVSCQRFGCVLMWPAKNA